MNRQLNELYTQIANSFSEIFEIKQDASYLVRYKLDSNSGLGFEEFQSCYDALSFKFPTNEFVFVPDELTIEKEFNTKDLVELCEDLQKYIETKEKEEEA